MSTHMKMLWYSLEAPWRNKKNIFLIHCLIWSYELPHKWPNGIRAAFHYKTVKPGLVYNLGKVLMKISLDVVKT